jgi:hypothetical protein
MWASLWSVMDVVISVLRDVPLRFDSIDVELLQPSMKEG